MKTLPLRLSPGADLRLALQQLLPAQGVAAAFVLAGIGSLSQTRLRLAGAAEPLLLHGDVELLALSGSLAPDGAHLHASVADAAGRVLGGHVAPGCIVRTTAELLLVLLPDWAFAREPDAVTGFAELCITRPGEGAGH
ncbi:MAG TPA: PPC domain-containing DNA-binding protein [Roseateles sp.]|nr:PPC domain-containing DNA-binding protein [Roseateles sp.]